MKRLLGFIALAIAILPIHASASLLIEPLIGYNLASTVEPNADSSVGYSGDRYTGGMGAAYGARLGYQKLGFQLGLDYLHSSIDMDHKDFKKDVTMDEWAAFVGFEFPILFRVYAGYIFSANGESTGYDTTTGTSFKLDFKSGSGMKAGVGFTLLPFLDINLEYRRGTFDEWKMDGFKMKSDVDYSSYMIGLSLPFTL